MTELAPRTLDEWRDIALAQGYTVKEHLGAQPQLRPFFLAHNKEGDITGAFTHAILRKAFIVVR